MRPQFTLQYKAYADAKENQAAFGWLKNPTNSSQKPLEINCLRGTGGRAYSAGTASSSIEMVQRGTFAIRSRCTERIRALVKVWPWVVPVTRRPINNATRNLCATSSSSVVKLGMIHSLNCRSEAASLMVNGALPAGFAGADNARIAA
jgi:hypothetical protein